MATVNGMFGRDVSGELHPLFGKNHSEVSKQLISKNHADFNGSKNGMFGKTHNNKTKIAQSNRMSKIESNGLSHSKNIVNSRIEKDGNHWNS